MKATAKSIRRRFPKASSRFVIRCLEQELTEREVDAKAMEELQSENERLKMEIAELEQKIEAEKQSLGGVAEANGRRNQPIGGPAAIKIRAEWRKLIDHFESKGMKRSEAVRAANRENPSLRQRLLEIVNRAFQ